MSDMTLADDPRLAQLIEVAQRAIDDAMVDGADPAAIACQLRAEFDRVRKGERSG